MYIFPERKINTFILQIKTFIVFFFAYIPISS